MERFMAHQGQIEVYMDSKPDYNKSISTHLFILPYVATV